MWVNTANDDWAGSADQNIRDAAQANSHDRIAGLYAERIYLVSADLTISVIRRQIFKEALTFTANSHSSFLKNQGSEFAAFCIGSLRTDNA